MSPIVKRLIFVFFVPFILFVSNSEDTVRLRLSEKSSTLYVGWFISVPYEEVSIQILNEGQVSTVTLDDEEGYQPICCFYGDVEATLIVLLSSGEIVTLVDTINIERPDVAFPEVPDTLIRPTTTTIPTTTTTIFTNREIESDRITTVTTEVTETEVAIVDLDRFSNFFDFSDVVIDNAILTKIPTVDDVDFGNIEKNNKASLNSFLILILFYFVLALQEWLNKLIDKYDLKFISKDKELQSNRSLKIFLGLFLVSLLIAFVEEGALISFEKDNLALFLATFISLLLATFFYDIVELIQEITFKDSSYVFDWSPQAIIFSVFSFIIFVYYELPIGFVFGYVVTLKIINTNEKDIAVSPKIFSNIVTLFAGVTCFFASGVDVVKDNILLSAVASLLFLFSIEGSFFKSLPIGGNEYVESFKDSKLVGKILSTGTLFASIWLFIRTIVLPSDGEVANFQNELVNMGEYSIYFGMIVLAYALLVLFAGLVLITFGEIEEEKIPTSKI